MAKYNPYAAYDATRDPNHNPFPFGIESTRGVRQLPAASSTNIEALQLRLDRLHAEAAAAQRKLELLEILGKDVYKDGACIFFKKTLRTNGGPVTYDYAAMKCVNGYWYTTGPLRGTTPRTWDELMSWLIGGEFPTTTFWLYTEMVQVGS